MTNSVNGTSVWSAIVYGKLTRNAADDVTVAPEPIAPYTTVGAEIVTSGFVVASVALTFVAPAPPALRTGTRRSIVSPASATPFALPTVPPTASSSIVGVPSASTGAATPVSVTVPWYGRESSAVTVTLNVPRLSGRNGSVICPAPSVRPVWNSSPFL